MGAFFAFVLAPILPTEAALLIGLVLLLNVRKLIGAALARLHS